MTDKRQKQSKENVFFPSVWEPCKCNAFNQLMICPGSMDSEYFGLYIPMGQGFPLV